MKVGSFMFTVAQRTNPAVVVQTALFKKVDCPKKGSEDERKLIMALISSQGENWN